MRLKQKRLSMNTHMFNEKLRFCDETLWFFMKKTIASMKIMIFHEKCIPVNEK